MTNQSDRVETGKICLVMPPSIFLLDERVFVNLGLLKVAAVLERAGVPLDVLDLSGIENFEAVLEDYCVQNPETRLFGLTSTTPQMPQTARIARCLRRAQPAARLILGGPHVTLIHTAYKKEVKRGVPDRATRAFEQLDAMFDVLVCGDGEDAVFEALRADAPKVIDANLKSSPLFMSNARYEAHPFPARHLVDLKSYHYQIDGFPATSLIAQLGCPFACGFCGGREAPFLRRIRNRSVANIVREVADIHRDYGYTGFMFYDDELNVNPEMVALMNALSDLQMSLGTAFRFRGFVKSELFTPEQAQAMYRAGFRWLLSGFESGSPRILENMNKKATRADNSRCMETAHRAGIKVKALMSLGHPGESTQTATDTLDWLLATQPDDFDVTIITTFPGTPYYDHAVPTGEPGIYCYTYRKTGDRLFQIELDYNETADYYKGDPNGGYRSFVYTDFLSPDELVTIRGDMEREVREKLGIPFNPAQAAVRYEHSMGQIGGGLPDFIHRRANTSSPVP
ncbi:B12-binding domain-containing radical SAM protein [Acanthopleuribacter pedis]|uniref:B12-binding domain-containing radical SAM protein n=1 Tax=Acanthopleuribacter pedis TaxID=442870 RepID=A0A8J7U176_9BACT|nr:radical SAM protein [Acanthopleuribacter pedis]MBO1317868.1 B12-binding domain-containing radical SAM protein [Acanthopleuribacter pedis]